MPCAVSDASLWAMLQEDAPHGDLTTRSLAIGGMDACMSMRARAGMTLCGTEEAARLIELSGGQVSYLAPSGTSVEAEQLLLSARGTAQAMHLAWKTAQTLIEYLSGIASCAAQMVAALQAAGHAMPIACTRKNFPGNRSLANKAISCGGAIAHRLGLSETVLVFAEHRAFFGEASIADKFSLVRASNPEKRLVVEVGSMGDALQCAKAGAEVLQLERFSPEALAQCKTQLAGAGLFPKLAPAGGVTLANQLAFAQAGADFLVSSAPYFAPPRDVRVVLAPEQA